jgi:membrane-associated phospholipid phosphatase
MSLSERREQISAGATPLQCLRHHIAVFIALIGRKQKPSTRRASAFRIGVVTVAAIIAIAATMIVADAWSVGVAQSVPEWLALRFDQVTHFGHAGWILVPIALMLAIVAAAASVLPPMSQRVLAAVAVRLAFVFWAVALPGVLFAIVKRLIGRGRPLVGGSADPFLYLPLSWNVEYASLPSGHAMNAFAAATAIGALWPKTRPLLWTYALIIATSRVVVTAHFPSDVLAGAIIGVTSALLLREWLAARRLAFAPAMNGGIRPHPGPSFARIKKVARQLVAP